MSAPPFDPFAWTQARRAWATSRQSQWQEFQGALPAPSKPPVFDFSHAQALRLIGDSEPDYLCHLGVGPTGKAASLRNFLRLGIAVKNTHGKELERWLWPDETDRLRAAMWSGPLTRVQASALALEAQGHAPAPWFLWACAAPSAPLLVEALMELGYRQPAMPAQGLLGLPFALGVIKAPMALWGSAVASMLDASSACDFVGQQERHSLYTPLQLMITRQGGDLRNHTQVSLAYQSAGLGFMGHFWREIAEGSNSDPLAPLAQMDYAKATLGPKDAGLGPSSRAEWPLHRAILDEPYQVYNAQVARLLGLGADPNAITLEGEPCWWTAAKPESEQGSEGHLSSMTPAIYQAYFDAGADFSIPVIAKYLDPQRSSLDQAYQRVLRSDQSLAVAQAREWVEKSAARAQARELDGALAPGANAPSARL